MRPIVLTQAIAAPPAAVLAAASDLAAAPAHIPGLLKIEGLTPGPLRVGTRWLETRRTPVGRKTLEVWITAADPARGYTAAWDLAGARFEAAFEVAPEPNTAPAAHATAPRTRCRMITTIQPRGGLSRLLLTLGRGSLTRSLQGDLDALKRAVESGAWRGPGSGL